ncbi:hypothetical protein L9F63_011293, partial [Diploptera punctata]
KADSGPEANTSSHRRARGTSLVFSHHPTSFFRREICRRRPTADRRIFKRYFRSREESEGTLVENVVRDRNPSQ